MVGSVLQLPDPNDPLVQYYWSAVHQYNVAQELIDYAESDTELSVLCMRMQEAQAKIAHARKQLRERARCV